MTVPRPQNALPAQFAELAPDSWTMPFWSAAHEHCLVAPRCTNCATFRFPPGPFCHVCRQQDVDLVELSGEGTVYTFTVARHPVVPELREHVPYVIAVVEPDGAPGVRMIVNVVESDPEAVAVGSRVAVFWDDVADDVTIPRFRLTT